MIRILFLSCISFLCFSVGVVAAPTHEVVTSFANPPSSPGSGTLTAGPGGRLWGTTTQGGAYNFGSIYSVDRSSGDWKTELSFTSNRTYDRGARPAGGLVYDGAGYLWGTTESGGAYGFGTVFKFNPATGELTTLVDFTNRNPGNRGAKAAGRLVSDGRGYYWGVTTYGGNSSGYGSIFKINISTGVLTTVVEFSLDGPINTGGYPLAGLVSDELGFLWGTTSEGGAYGRGTVFKVNVETGELTTVMEFSPGGGAYPAGELVRDGAGFLWGSTVNGGSSGYGLVFKINISTGALSTVVEFKNSSTTTKGAYPYGGLASDGAGSWWGTTSEGGVNGVGTIFKINESTGVLTTVAELRANSGAANTGTNPKAGLFNDGAGFLWGTTGQESGTDTVFKINIGTGALTTVVGFATNLTANKGLTPQGGLVGDGKGFLWGTTRAGGPKSQGTIFKTHEVTGQTTTVVEFTENGTRGAWPSSELVSDGKGFFWGTTEGGGSTGGYGTVFKVNMTTGALTTVVDFGNTGPIIGSTPRGGLVADGAGFVWGTTYSGGNDSAGTIFKVSESTGALTTVYQFATGRESPNGRSPIGALVNDGAGYLWGTTSEGGTTANGSVFKVSISSGTFTRVALFSTPSSNGAYPYAGVVSGGNGYFYGTTQKGGTANFGTVFKIQASSGARTRIADFTSIGASSKGAYPLGELTNDGAGYLWGTTSRGGSGDFGTVFKVNAASGEVTTLVEFSGTGPQVNSGATPGYGPLLRHTDGNYYGTTAGGGPGGAGTVFRIRLGPTPVTREVSDLSTSRVTLHGTLNPNGTAGTAGFEWGTDPQLLTREVVSAGPTSAGTVPEAISVTLSGLAPATTYFYRVRGTNAESTVPQRGAILSFATVNPDEDGDGLPDAWETEHFGSTAGHDALGDDDQDGLVELLEYAFQLNPRRADVHAMPAARIEGGYLTISVPKVPGVTYVVQSASSLAPADWSAASTTVLLDSETELKVRDNVRVDSSGRRFLRIRVSAP